MKVFRPPGRPTGLRTFARLGVILGAAALAWPAGAQPAAPWEAPPKPPAATHADAASTGTSATPTRSAALGGAPAGGTVDRTGVIEVYKHLAGPALWKVQKGDAQVFILGAATPLPHMLEWDTLRLENALNGADALYLQPQPSLSRLDLVKLALNRAPLQLPGGQTLQAVLPPREKARYLRLVAQIHAKPQTYDRWKPAIAGLLLIGDWRKAAGLSEAKPGSTVMHLAQDAHVPVQTVGDFHLDPYIAATLSPADNIACFDAAMDDVDQESGHVPAMAAAWARGDLKTVGETYKVSLLNRCLEHIPSVQNVLDRGTEAGVHTIQTALVKPGKSVAVIDLNFLLRPDGVLDRLKAAGATVSIPE